MSATTPRVDTRPAPPELTPRGKRRRRRAGGCDAPTIPTSPDKRRGSRPGTGRGMAKGGKTAPRGGEEQQNAVGWTVVCLASKEIAVSLYRHLPHQFLTVLFLLTSACSSQTLQGTTKDLLSDGSAATSDLATQETKAADIPDVTPDLLTNLDLTDIPDLTNDWPSVPDLTDILDIATDVPTKPDLTDILDVTADIPDLTNDLPTAPDLTDILDVTADLPTEADLADIAMDGIDLPNLPDIASDETAEPDLTDMLAADVVDFEIFDLVPEEVSEPPCEVTLIPSCTFHFSIEPTYPVVQEYVWLTGSFSGWASNPAEGAVPLELNDTGTLWQLDLVLDDDLLLEYKFLMGWADNPDPSWVTQDWDFSGGAQNSKVHALCGETGCGDPQFIRHPRLQWPTDKGFWILVETDINVPLEYAVSWDGGGSVVASAPELIQVFWVGPAGEHPPGYQHRTFVPLPTEVAQATVQIINGPQWQQTVTRPHLADPLRLAVYGDTRSQSDPHQMVVDAVVEQGPDAVLVTGDMIDIAVHLSEWEEWADIEEKILESAFWLPVYGNHDTIEGGKGRPYLETWFQTDNRYRSGGSYWLDLGLVGLVVLDTYGTDFTQPEGLVWLGDALASLQEKKWLFVAFHEPYYSFMGHPPWLAGLEFIDPLIQAYNVDIVFNGHDHAYEHFLVGETHYMVAGGGGAPLSDFTGPPPPELAPLLVASGAFYHYILLDITANSLTAKVVQLPEDVVVDEMVLVK
jgi:hypothetical protein